MSMDRRERWESPEEAILAAQEGHQANIWTALPGIIESFDPGAKTVTVQPAIKAKVTFPDNSVQWVSLPILVDVPVHFPSGGGYTLTFPIQQGDEALVIFSSRCIDAWWQSGGVQVQAELRMHDLSDGFALVGISSQPNVPANISLSAVQLRSNDGATYVEISGQDVNVVAPSSVKVTTPSATFTGDLVVDGNVSDGTGSMAQIRAIYDSHDHPGDSGGTTGPPNQQM